MISMQSLLTVFVLGLVFIQEGYGVHMETCSCSEIDDMVKTTAHDVIKMEAGKFNDTLHSLLEPIAASLGYHYSVNGTKKNPAASCLKLKELKYGSGHYWVKSSKSGSTAVKVYCNMKLTCGDITGGWMRVADLDMRDSSQSCPPAFTTITAPKRLCDHPSYGSCVGTKYSAHKFQYSHVCGRVIGYQTRTPISFYYKEQINQPYVYGVSLTHGPSNSRSHIWTFAGASDEDSSNYYYKCPCINTNIKTSITIPTFVGKDYFCDTALTSYSTSGGLRTDDPLWDGKGCGSHNTCCNFPGSGVRPPWFYKQLSSATIDDIEMRLCRISTHGSTPIEIVELYIQ